MDRQLQDNAESGGAADPQMTRSGPHRKLGVVLMVVSLLLGLWGFAQVRFGFVPGAITPVPILLPFPLLSFCPYGGPCRVGEFSLNLGRLTRSTYEMKVDNYSSLCEDPPAALNSPENRMAYPDLMSRLFEKEGRGCRLVCGPGTTTCQRVEQCSQNCQRSQIAYHCKSAKEREQKEADCRERLKCTVFGVKPNELSMADKQKYFYGLLQEVTTSEAFQKKWPSLSKQKDLAAHFLCVNLKKENTSLDILNVNNTHCGSTALGFGQVVNTTFLGTLGLNSSSFKHAKDRNLSELCAQNSPRMRSEVWCPGEGNETVGEVFESSTFQPRQQVKGMVAAFLNHYRAAGENWERAWSDYYGAGQEGGVWTTTQRRRIAECVNQIHLAGYTLPSERSDSSK